MNATIEENNIITLYVFTLGFRRFVLFTVTLGSVSWFWLTILV